MVGGIYRGYGKFKRKVERKRVEKGKEVISEGLTGGVKISGRMD